MENLIKYIHFIHKLKILNLKLIQKNNKNKLKNYLKNKKKEKDNKKKNSNFDI